MTQRLLRSLIALLIPVSLSLAPAARAASVAIRVDATRPGEPLRSVWHYYGFDECNYTTAPDSLALIKTVVAANQPNPVYLREHFLLNSGDGTPALKWGSTGVYSEDAQGKPVYSWGILDGIFDAITTNGARPLFELGMMPEALTSHTGSYRNSGTYQLDGGALYPPKDYTKWADLIRSVAEHVKQRYPGAEHDWLYELWNEPDIAYWRGTPEEYFKLFDYTENALHGVMPEATLGGPHAASAGGRFLRDFLRHCAEGTNAVTGQTGTQLDYVGFHAKGGVEFIGGHVRMNLGNQLRLHQSGFRTVAEVAKFHDTPIIIGEADPDGCAGCPSSSSPERRYRNSPAYGAYEVATMKYSLDLAHEMGVNLKGVLTWAWMFDGQPIFEGFRTLSTHGIDKPVLNAFKLLGRMQGRELPLESDGAIGLQGLMRGGARRASDVNGMAALDGKTVRAIVWNYADDLVTTDPAHVSLTIQLPEGAAAHYKLTHWRVDEQHSDAFTKWQELGSPEAPDADQMELLKRAMQLEQLDPERTVANEGGSVTLNFDLPRFGLSLIELTPES